MLYTDTDSFFLHFFVDDLAKEINDRPDLRDAFDFSEISNGQFSNLGRGNADLHAGEVGFFKDETKGNPIVEFVGLCPKMCDVSFVPNLPFFHNVRRTRAHPRDELPDGCAAQRGGKGCGALPN